MCSCVWSWDDISPGHAEDILVPHSSFALDNSCGVFVTTKLLTGVKGFTLTCVFEDELAHHELVCLEGGQWTINSEEIPEALADEASVIRYLTEDHFDDPYPWMTPLSYYISSEDKDTVLPLDNKAFQAKKKRTTQEQSPAQNATTTPPNLTTPAPAPSFTVKDGDQSENQSPTKQPSSGENNLKADQKPADINQTSPLKERNQKVIKVADRPIESITSEEWQVLETDMFNNMEHQSLRDLASPDAQLLGQLEQMFSPYKPTNP